MPVSRPTRIALGVAAGVVAVDQVTKAIAASALDDRGPVHVAGGVHLLLYRNHAGPGNLLQGHPVLVSTFVFVAVLVMVAVALFVRTGTAGVVLGLMLGGGAGNLADRLLRGPGPFRGGVVDWLQPHVGGGSMNLADLSLNLALLVAVAAALVGAVRPRLSARAVARRAG